VEFVLVLPVVLILLVLVVEVGVIARTSLSMLGAVREGVRVAAITVETDDAIEATRAALGPELASRTRVAVRRPPVVGEPAEVTVSGEHRVLEVLGGFAIPLEYHSTMRTER
jgi:hypothetical protein